MFKNLPSLEQLMQTLQQVPHLPTKNIFKVVDFFLNMPPEKLEQFCNKLKEAKNDVIFCPDCFFFAQKEQGCQFCTSLKRNKKIICVVETWHDVLAIEKTAGFEGLYHVLGGSLSPLEGIGPDQLTVNKLVERVKNKQVEEIILCTNQTPEGEATAMFVAKKLKNLPVIISCLARGLPVGAMLENSDKLTVYKALSNRRPY